MRNVSSHIPATYLSFCAFPASLHSRHRVIVRKLANGVICSPGYPLQLRHPLSSMGDATVADSIITRMD